MKNNSKNGFTLVELLAVIVILAIILVIAVPKIMSVIEDAKKAILESTAKMIASAAEKAKVQNTVLGNNEVITCKDITNINDIDYERCIVEFDYNGNALVTIKGSGKFYNLYVCEGNKTSATASNDVCNVVYGNASSYIEKLEAFKANENHLKKTSATYNEIKYDAGISYGNEGYNYDSSCEVWRIIGLFDVKNESGDIEKRVKLINTASTFKASWDSSNTAVNVGWGINQWGESIYEDEKFYEGSDLMRLLNGFYISKLENDCIYCSGRYHETCNNICTSESLENEKMKVLTNTAKGMIDNAVWDTYGVNRPSDDVPDGTWAPNAYLQEKGISSQDTGKTLCLENGGGDSCSDSIKRTTSWIGLVGLMSVSDMTYADGWLYNQNGTSVPHIFTITPSNRHDTSRNVWIAVHTYASDWACTEYFYVFPSIYLKSNIEIIGGNGGNDNPYILK